MLEIRADGRVGGTAEVPSAEELSAKEMKPRGIFRRNAKQMTAALGRAPRVEEGRWSYLLKTPEGVARLTAPRGRRTTEVSWSVETPDLGPMPWAADAVTRRASSFFGWVRAGGNASRRDCAMAYVERLSRWRGVLGDEEATARQLDVVLEELSPPLYDGWWTIPATDGVPVLAQWPMEDRRPTFAWQEGEMRLAGEAVQKWAARLAPLREEDLGRLRAERRSRRLALYADYVDALHELAGEAFPGDAQPRE